MILYLYGYNATIYDTLLHNFARCNFIAFTSSLFRALRCFFYYIYFYTHIQVICLWLSWNDRSLYSCCRLFTWFRINRQQSRKIKAQYKINKTKADKMWAINTCRIKYMDFLMGFVISQHLRVIYFFFQMKFFFQMNYYKCNIDTRRSKRDIFAEIKKQKPMSRWLNEPFQSKSSTDLKSASALCTQSHQRRFVFICLFKLLIQLFAVIIITFHVIVCILFYLLLCFCFVWLPSWIAETHSFIHIDFDVNVMFKTVAEVSIHNHAWLATLMQIK